MSDSHDRWDNLEKAVKLANENDCKILLFAGDFCAPTGIPVLEKFNGDVKFVWGNNEAEKMGLTRKCDASKKIQLCGNIFEGVFDGVKIFMNHYPRISELAAKSGEFDLCIYGHLHEYHEEKVNKCLLVNPGEIQGFASGNVTFMIYDTKKNEIKKINVK